MRCYVLKRIWKYVSHLDSVDLGIISAGIS